MHSAEASRQGRLRRIRQQVSTSAGAEGRGRSDIGGGSANGGGDRPASDLLAHWPVRIQSAIAASRRIRGGNYVQLATVDASGSPHCRTVVFRGFLEASGRGGRSALQMITDARSEKVQQAQHHAGCELVWWFSETSEQYRFRGELQFVGSAEQIDEFREARASMWSKLSDNAREQFFWDAPGLSYTGHQASIPPGGRASDGSLLPPPETFLLVLLWPEKVKYLRLRDNLSIVDLWQQPVAGSTDSVGTWMVQRVNP